MLFFAYPSNEEITRIPKFHEQANQCEGGEWEISLRISGQRQTAAAAHLRGNQSSPAAALRLGH